MTLTSTAMRRLVENQITDFARSQLFGLAGTSGNYAIKYVRSERAKDYEAPGQTPLYVSKTPALTWGTATYVAPVSTPLTSALYGRVGLVSTYDPTGWRVFDATRPAAASAYIAWVKSQPSHFRTLLLTVHSTLANHALRNAFRETFLIDCVLFRPDEEAEAHTVLRSDVWMAVSEWSSHNTIIDGPASRFSEPRFTILIDEEFNTTSNGPTVVGTRKLEPITDRLNLIARNPPIAIGAARIDPTLPVQIVTAYNGGGYFHIYIDP